jgi:hypothetical protein
MSQNAKKLGICPKAPPNIDHKIKACRVIKLLDQMRKIRLRAALALRQSGYDRE